MSITDLIDVAIDRERTAYERYLEAANQASTISVRDIFNWLAGQEYGHICSLNKLKEFYMISGDERTIDKEAVRQILEIVQAEEAEAGLNTEDVRNTRQVLQIAMEGERSSIRLYRRAFYKTQDQGLRTLFEELVLEEQDHLTTLQGMYQPIA